MLNRAAATYRKHLVAGAISALCALSGVAIAPSPVTLAIEQQSNAQALYEQGIEQAANQQYEAAMASFTAAIAIQPEFAAAYSARGRAQVIVGDRRAAFEDLEQSAHLHITQEKLEEALDDMNLMIELVEMGIRRSPQI
ncbi:MAG: hypothetical protein F6K19_14710 [Cyanothece sp. SIO1E1]|nr:hypothetical protein [Cyanothece sp. SIO1E1]